MNILLYSGEPVTGLAISLFLSDRTGLTVSRHTGEPEESRGEPGDLVIVDSDTFADIRRMPVVLHRLAEAGFRVLVLCSFLDSSCVPEHQNLFKLEKPYRLKDIHRFVNTAGLPINTSEQP